MTHAFDKYLQRKGHYPRVVVNNGVQRLTVEFTPGYVRIKTSSPYGGEVYITAATIRKLIKRGLFVKMLAYHRLQDRSFDVPRAVHRAGIAEREHLDALRREKRSRKSGLSSR